MKRIFVLTLLVFLMVPAITVPLASAENTAHAKWTFMVYMDADNNLDPAGVDDLSEMQMVGSTLDVNIVVLFDRYDKLCGYNGSVILYIGKGYNVTVWGGWTDKYELNMGDPKTLSWFIDFVVENYPADKYALILWDHGGNWEGVCWDWTNDDYLSIFEVREALASLPVEISLLGFDACLMASIEVGYELSLTNRVNVMVASEDFVPWDGYPYDMILTDLTENPAWDEDTFAVHIVDNYIASYTHTACFATLAAINLRTIGTLVEDLKNLTIELISNFAIYRRAVTGAKNGADRYWFGFWHQGPYIDLHQFIYQLGVIEKKLKPYTDPILDIWDSVVLYSKCCNGPHVKSGAGLTIYFPRNKQLFYTPESYLESVTSFAEYTGWYTLLTMYFENHTKN
ncbi:MAG: clostripain-related cysteine peptidase [Candidatus Bathyarchaeia archaeon]